MQTYLTRLTTWAAITLTAVAVMAADIVPAVHAGLTDAVSLCTPADVHGAQRAGATTPCPTQAATLHVPRCGVA
jgi:hypothetical protein